MGDPAGIGPEVLVRAASRASVRRVCRLTVFGDSAVLALARRAVGIAAKQPSAIETVVALPEVRLGAGRPRPGKRAGRAAFAYVQAAAHSVLAGDCDALVTAPVNKAWIAASGRRFDGHTGYLSKLCGRKAVMMLAGRHLRVVLVTEHLAHRAVARCLSSEAIEYAARTTVRHLELYSGIPTPRLAVAALNPHAGENGLFGDEEARVIAPALRKLRQRRMHVDGPLPADTLFAAARDDTYDAVICMYHDQALIPLKLLEFGRSVNISMGLPLVRTSPDHGTAYALAGTGRADDGSMLRAVLCAASMVRVSR